MTAAGAAERPPDDAELARRIGQRDERAFETLMRAHNRLLYRLARSILKDDAEAEDAECLNVPPATVRTRAFRARAMLRESLSREIDVATVNVFGFGGERCDRIVASVLERLRLDVPSP